MAFVVYSMGKKRTFIPYLFLSMMFHLSILLISKIVILASPSNPEESPLVVKLMDIAEQRQIIISKPPKRTKLLQTRKVPKPTTNPPILKKQDFLKQLPLPLSLNRTKSVAPPAVLEKPVLPGVKHKAHILQNLLNEGKEELLHYPQITDKKLLSANPIDIGTESTDVAKPAQIATFPGSRQGKEIFGLIEGERSGFKQPAEALAIGDSLREINTPLIGRKYIPLDSKDPDLAPYLAYIKERILQFWRYPEEAQPALKGQIDLAFTVERDGNVSEIKLVTSSQYKVLDKGVLSAIERAAPFKPIPLEIKEKRLPLLGTFIYNKPGYSPNQPKN